MLNEVACNFCSVVSLQWRQLFFSETFSFVCSFHLMRISYVFYFSYLFAFWNLLIAHQSFVTHLFSFSFLARRSMSFPSLLLASPNLTLSWLRLFVKCVSFFCLYQPSAKNVIQLSFLFFCASVSTFSRFAILSFSFSFVCLWLSHAKTVKSVCSIFLFLFLLEFMASLTLPSSL